MINDYISNTIYNVDKLISIKKVQNKVSSYIEYKKEINFFNITFRKPGFYTGCGNIIKKEELESDAFIVKDKTVFLKPHLEVYFIDDPYKVIYFDTVEEMEQFIVKLTKNKTFVDIKNNILIEN